MSEPGLKPEKNLGSNYPKNPRGIFKMFKGRTPMTIYETKGILLKSKSGVGENILYEKEPKALSKLKSPIAKSTELFFVPKEKAPESARADIMRKSANADIFTFKSSEEKCSLPPLSVEKQELQGKGESKFPQRKISETEQREQAQKFFRPPPLHIGSTIGSNRVLSTYNPHPRLIKAFAADTDRGLVRNYNEDRVTIIYNYQQPANLVGETKWPSVSYFGLFDGHGGKTCADYLKDNLHQFVLTNPLFPENPKEALIEGFAKAEESFLKKASANPESPDTSGSCALVVMIVGNTCFVANVGDSRAVLSSQSGRKVLDLSVDHKPENPDEAKRIYQAGGRLYQ